MELQVSPEPAASPKQQTPENPAGCPWCSPSTYRHVGRLPVVRLHRRSLTASRPSTARTPVPGRRQVTHASRISGPHPQVTIDSRDRRQTAGRTDRNEHSIGQKISLRSPEHEAGSAPPAKSTSHPIDSTTRHDPEGWSPWHGRPKPPVRQSGILFYNSLEIISTYPPFRAGPRPPRGSAARAAESSRTIPRHDRQSTPRGANYRSFRPRPAKPGIRSR